VRKLVEAALRSYGTPGRGVQTTPEPKELWAPIAELEEAAWARTIDVNLKGTWLSMKDEIPAMAERGGAIVNIATIAAMAGVPGTTIYAASKGGGHCDDAGGGDRMGRQGC